MHPGHGEAGGAELGSEARELQPLLQDFWLGD